MIHQIDRNYKKKTNKKETIRECWQSLIHYMQNIEMLVIEILRILRIVFRFVFQFRLRMCFKRNISSSHVKYLYDQASTNVVNRL